MTLAARAAALAAQLAASRVIAPTLTDDAAMLTVTLDEAAILAAFEETRREALEEARPVETAPYETPLIVWLYLPKNPPASSWTIAQRCLVEPGTEIPDEGIGAREPGCWWANIGRYYPPGHVTHWMPLPPMPVAPNSEKPASRIRTDGPDAA